MNQKNHKPNWVSYIGILVIVEYIMYLFAGAWEKGNTYVEYIPKLMEIFHQPFGWYWNRYTMAFMAAGAVVVALMYLWEFSKPNYAKNPFGSAKWGDVEKISKKLTDANFPHNNRIYSEKFRISMNPKIHNFNNLAFVIGGSGTGKSAYVVRPNTLECNSTYVITDPKGELLADMGNYLQYRGYCIKVINMVNMKLSDHYNPFVYLETDIDVDSLVNIIISNTNGDKQNAAGDPFWENSEKMFLKMCIYYVWKEYRNEPRMNFGSVLELMRKAVYDEESGICPELDVIMMNLDENHPARVNYENLMSGAGKTIQSIIISAKVRMALFDNPDLLRVLSRDDLDIASLGMGVGLDKKTKTALFCVIPDSDKTLNFVIGLLYTQIFQRLNKVADEVCHGGLPIPVTFVFDEFANVSIPRDFFKTQVSIMRSRNMSAILFLQNMAQIKAMYEKEWEAIIGNCDVLLYLGGNEQGTHEYISKKLGKATIYKRSSSVSRGQHGSSSQSTDATGRELMTSDEVGRMPNQDCIVFCRGQYPIYDRKYPTFQTPEYKEMVALGLYQHKPAAKLLDETDFKVLSLDEITTYEELRMKYPNQIRITTLTMEQIMQILAMVDAEAKEHQAAQQQMTTPHGDLSGYRTLEELLLNEQLTEQEQLVMEQSIEAGLNDSQVITVLQNIGQAEVYLNAFQQLNYNLM